MQNNIYKSVAFFLATGLFISQASAMERQEDGGLFSRISRAVREFVSPRPPVSRPVASAKNEVDRLWESIARASSPPLITSQDHFTATQQRLEARWDFIENFGWSVPSKKAVKAIQAFVGTEKCLEIASGKGLWAHLLKQAGVDIQATDINPPTSPFCDIEKLAMEDAFKKYVEQRVLFFSWLPLDDTSQGWGNCENPTPLFQGNKIIYIGEPQDGATGGMPDRKKWVVEKTVEIPRLEGANDEMIFFIRKFDMDKEESLHLDVLFQ